MAQNFKKCNNNDVTKNQEKARKKGMQIWKCEMSHIDPWGHGKKRTRKSNDEKKRKRNELEDLLFKKSSSCQLSSSYFFDKDLEICSIAKFYSSFSENLI